MVVLYFLSERYLIKSCSHVQVFAYIFDLNGTLPGYQMDGWCTKRNFPESGLWLHSLRESYLISVILDDPCEGIPINCECSFIYNQQGQQTPCSADVEYQGANYKLAETEVSPKESYRDVQTPCKWLSPRLVLIAKHKRPWSLTWAVLTAQHTCHEVTILERSLQ